MLIVADFDNQAFIIGGVKKLIVVLVAAFSLITACMLYLIKEGVSLRLGRVIDPTLMSLGEREIARGIVSRLTPVFQPSKYVVFGIDKEDPQTQALIENLKTEFARDFKVAPKIVDADSDFLSTCEAHCWVMTSPGESTHLQKSELIEKLESTGDRYFTISVLRFDRDADLPKHCESEKRISIDCITPLAVRESRRKFKEEAPYFFVRNYNEQDYFLFLEN
jgi:hypothetical protein